MRNGANGVGKKGEMDMADKLITIRVPEDVIRLDYMLKDTTGYDAMQPVTAGMIVRVEDTPEE